MAAVAAVPLEKTTLTAALTAVVLILIGGGVFAGMKLLNRREVGVKGDK